ncbi:MAG TPA: cell division protein FtsL [Persephonella sp.]|nr:cell division protein FtsL [Persephonella sp.]
MIREAVLELKRDFLYIKRYIKFWVFLLSISGTLVLYNQYYFKVDKEITELIQIKNQLTAKNMMLKKEITGLSSPDRIGKIAQKKLGMKPVDYSNVRFIDQKDMNGKK